MIMERADVSLKDLFLVFAKVGAFTIGGGYAMISIIQEEVSRRGWLSDEEMPDIVALSQSAPGLLAVNISIFTGYRLRGVKGSIVATVGAVLPSFITILLIAALFGNFKDNPVVIRIFKGMRPVVIALIAVPMIRMAEKVNHDWTKWTVSVLSLVLVAFLKVSPIYVLAVIIACGTAFYYWREHR